MVYLPFILLALSSLQTASSLALTSNLGPVVDLGYAAFAGNSTSPAGVKNSPVTFFGNVPYAQPPVGNLRFRAPQPLNENAKAQKVADARNWGPPCIQSPAEVGVGSEDCLTLNVWHPTNASEGAKLPVVVYIHGGGFTTGTPQGFPLYDWVDQHPGGLVGVSITYRLNILGFLGGSQVAADGALNAGLLDQRAGLEWVQRHITKFGGDPDNVTIMGESAGGAGVIMQTVAFGGSKPAPFKRSVPHSIGWNASPTVSEAQKNLDAAADVIGCPTSDKTTMSCLRSASVGAIVAAINSKILFTPVIEGPGGFLPDIPSRLIAAGNFSTVDVMAGHCTGDGATFTPGTPDQYNTDDDIRRMVLGNKNLTDNTIAQALALYPAPGPGSEFATQYDRAAAISGDTSFTCLDFWLAQNAVKKGINNVFTFSWNAPDPLLFSRKPFVGTAHTSDLYYLFEGTNTFNNAGDTFTPFNTSESILATQAIAYWTSFVAQADPSVQKESAAPVWAKFATGIDSETRSRLRLTRGDDTTTATQMEVIPPVQVARCEFWMSDAVASQTRV